MERDSQPRFRFSDLNLVIYPWTLGGFCFVPPNRRQAMKPETATYTIIWTAWAIGFGLSFIVPPLMSLCMLVAFIYAVKRIA